MRSMTGFGRATVVEGTRTIEVEARSVNNRFLRVQTRCSRELAAYEQDVEAAVRGRVARGTVNLSIRLRDEDALGTHTIDVDAARGLMASVRGLSKSLDLRGEPSLGDLLTLPGVVVPVERGGGEDVALQAHVRRAVDEALGALVTMRDAEGATLKAELVVIRNRIGDAVRTIKDRAPLLVREYQERLTRRLQALLADQPGGVVLDDATVAREVAVLADRSDIAEELQRLDSHLGQFDALLDQTDVGRRLEFLLQEMLREANTIASKAADAQIAHRVVEIKTELERLREQAQNVE